MVCLYDPVVAGLAIVYKNSRHCGDEIGVLDAAGGRNDGLLENMS
jgi:hypothetical protein